MIKDYEGGKLMMVTAHQPGMFHSTIATMILENKNKVIEAVKGSASLKAMRPIKIEKGLCQT